jgi:hypothetical protein
MMPVAISIFSGSLLAVLLFRVWRSNCLPSGPSYEFDRMSQEWATCPPECVSAIFALEDQQFLAGLDSPSLTTLFLKERTAVAREWLRATAGLIQQIMREHLQISRHSSDMEIRAELQIYASYILLQAACASLMLSLKFAGPARLRAASLYVYRASEQLSASHGVLKAAFASRQLQGAAQV